MFNVEAFFKELAELETKGVPRVHKRIHVSSRCHLNLRLHAAVDGLSEKELGMNSIGTTKKGIGPVRNQKSQQDVEANGDLTVPWDSATVPRPREMA